MRAIMDLLYACLTEIDLLIRRQRRAQATVDALQNMNKLEKTRAELRSAQIRLANIEGDALPTGVSPPGAAND